MNVVSSYKVAILRQNHIFKDTIAVYRDALAFLVQCFDTEWDVIQSVEGAKSRFNFAEHLIHNTSHNTAKYNFDECFPKMPSYLRRAAVQAALGAVKSYHSNLSKWEAGDKTSKPPKLQYERNVMPTFYNKAMYSKTDDSNFVYLKLYHQHDWVWVKIQLRATDVKYLQKHWHHCTPSAPILEKHYGKYYLRFAFTENVILSDIPIEDRVICAVDLGLNTDAVCSIMTSDGTVLARKFIDFPSEKDHLYHVLNRIKRQQRQYGPKNVRGLWHYAQRCNDELAKQIAASITEFAKMHNVDVIVFEHLDFKGKKHKGNKAQRLSMWKRNSIQNYVSHKAHRGGMRISHICAWKTSQLAFDGSGTLKRDSDNRALATFQNNKRYNCDLSASYNIGARYFIRELIKPLSVTARSQLLAEVPEAERRTSCTLSTLWAVSAHLAA